MSSPDRAYQRSRAGGVGLATILAVLAGYYLVRYFTNINRPIGGAATPIDWWTWFDQGEYLKSIRGFAVGSFTAPEHLYPPLYALLASPFWWLSHDHPTLAPDLAYFLVAYGVLIHVSARFYGRRLPLLVCAALLLLLPGLTILEWVIPWTSSLQAALVSVLIGIYARAERRPSPFALASRADWGWFAAFFAAFGALAPTRPLDTVIWFPFALAFFLRSLSASVRAAPAGRRIRTAAAACLLAGGPASLLAAAYLGFNLAVHHSLFGRYASAAGANGYFLGDIGEKAFSIFRASGVAYGEAGQALFERVPVFGAVFAVCAVALFLTRGVRRWIVLTALLNFLAYLPYGDFLPSGFFRYHNLHYFKWAYPWLAVIATGEVWGWVRDRRWAPVAASAALIAGGSLAGLRPADSQRVATVRSAREHRVEARVQRSRPVEFIDIGGVNGEFSYLYAANNHLILNGTELPPQFYKVMPIQAGVRLTLVRPAAIRSFALSMDPHVTVEDGPGEAILNGLGLGLACELRACEPPLARVPLTWSLAGDGRRTVALDFRSGGDAPPLPKALWWEPEYWGTWTKAATTRLDLIAAPMRRLEVFSTAGPLLGRGRRRGWAALYVNGCRLGLRRFEAGDPVKPIGGPVPARCLSPDGEIRVEWRTGRTARPDRLGLGEDRRVVGIGVRDLTLAGRP